MAQGNYIEEITLISLLLENKLVKEIVKPRFFKIEPDVFISKLSDKFSDINIFDVDTRVIIKLINNVIDSNKESNKINWWHRYK